MLLKHNAVVIVFALIAMLLFAGTVSGCSCGPSPDASASSCSTGGGSGGGNGGGAPANPLQPSCTMALIMNYPAYELFIASFTLSGCNVPIASATATVTILRGPIGSKGNLSAMKAVATNTREGIPDPSWHFN